MRTVLLCGLIGCVCISVSICFAADNYRVSAIMHSDILVLDKQTSAILAGIQTPVYLKAAVNDFLKKEFLNMPVMLELGKKARNRHNRYIAHIKRTDGKWVQGELVQKGLAYVYITEDNILYESELFTLEEKARKNRKGIWKRQKVLSAEEAIEDLKNIRNKFVLIQGKILDVYEGTENIYINFGNDWKTDVTASIAKYKKKEFKPLLDAGLIGKEVRIRGWVESYNGPYIRLYHKYQVETFNKSNDY